MPSTTPPTISDQQERERALDTSTSFIVQAPAGSGKTSLLVQRYLALLAQVDYPEEIIAITFTRKAAAEMRQRIVKALNRAAATTTNGTNDSSNNKDTAPNNATQNAAANAAQSDFTKANNNNLDFYKTNLYILAQRVLQQNAARGWQLLENPYRLHLQTIDSFCHQLVARTPLTSGLAAIPNIAPEQEAAQHYRTAINALLEGLEDSEFEQRAHLENLLLQLDNNVERFTALCIEMLKRREQWLPYIVGIRTHDPEVLRAMLEQNLATLAHEAIEQCQQNFPQEYFAELIVLLEAARENLDLELHAAQQANSGKSLEKSANLANSASPEKSTQAAELAKPTKKPAKNKNLDKYKIFLPKVDFGAALAINCDSNNDDNNIENALTAWRQIANLLLTQSNTWRKLFDKSVGFPASKSVTDQDARAYYQDLKERITALTGSLSNNNDHDKLAHALQEIKDLPTPTYSDGEWQALASLIELLPLLAAQLEVTFRTAGAADYTAVALAAERALGTSDTPTDLALHLDYRIKHILVDEFQDISLAQYRLLQQLTAGWENSDGRTLFLVGDPMQSIYRFRQAEVGLFLRAAQAGVGNVRLTKLQLTTNFRSTPNVVAWINNCFANIFPTFEDIALGCIPFCAAIAGTPTKDFVAVGSATEDFVAADFSQRLGAPAKTCDYKEHWDEENFLTSPKVHVLTYLDSNKGKKEKEKEEKNSNRDNDSSNISNIDDASSNISDTAIDADADTIATAACEAQHVAALSQNIALQNPHDTIAILVSARSHLSSIIPALKTAHVSYNAVDLEPLSASVVIQDLFALLRALTNFTDRIAWLAILRAPWCGLCLRDLHVLAHANAGSNTQMQAQTQAQIPARLQTQTPNNINISSANDSTIFDTLNIYDKLTTLSADGTRRIARILPIIQNSIYQRGRHALGLRGWLENTWLALGGAACVENEYELEHATQFFNLLDVYTANSSGSSASSYTIDAELLEKRLENLYLSGANPQAQIEIMTIHKAKGLEFDHVVVCGLHNKMRSDEHQLLMWLERPRAHDDVAGGGDLLLAPLKAVGAKESAIYSYLRNIEQQKDYYENGRLLYVAATRAKKSLNLVACVKSSNVTTGAAAMAETATTAMSSRENSEAITTPSSTQKSEKPKRAENKIKSLSKTSLLQQLMPCFEDKWIIPKLNDPCCSRGLQSAPQESQEPQEPRESQERKLEPAATKTSTKILASAITTRRLALNWRPPSQIAEKISRASQPHVMTEECIVQKKLFDDAPARLGTVIHKCLQQLAQSCGGSSNCQHHQKYQQSPPPQRYCMAQNYCTTQHAYWRKLLLQTGLYSELEQHLAAIDLAITNMLTSERGLWILDTRHQDVSNEYAIATIGNGNDNGNSNSNGMPIKHLIIDRTFLDKNSIDTGSDKNNRVRWIIDYKTTFPKKYRHGNLDNCALDNFIKKEQEIYKPQLELYAAAFQHQENFPIMLGIYFPLCNAWCEWKG